MKTLHRVLALLALAGGAFAVVAGTPQAPLAADEISAVELAQWLRERRGGLQIVDLRADAEAADGVPGALRAADAGHAAAAQHGIVVVYAQRDVGADTLAALRLAGNAAQVRRLRGGLAAWQRDVLYPVLRADASPAQRQQFSARAALSRYFGGSPRQLAPGEALPQLRSRRGC